MEGRGAQSPYFNTVAHMALPAKCHQATWGKHRSRSSYRRALRTIGVHDHPLLLQQVHQPVLGVHRGSCAAKPCRRLRCRKCRGCSAADRKPLRVGTPERSRAAGPTVAAAACPLPKHTRTLNETLTSGPQAGRERRRPAESDPSQGEGGGS